MSPWQEVLLILGMLAVTFGVRYASLALTGRFPPPPRAVRLLAYVPVAVLTALVVPYVVIRDGEPALGLDNAYLVGAIIAVLISYTGKNLLLTIIGGMLVFFGYQALL